MNDFERALQATLRYEGGFVHHPADPGGATNRGVTQGVYNAYRLNHGLGIRGVQLISNAEVRDIYRTLYWDEVTKGRTWALNAVLFDAAVNSGVKNALWMLEQAKKQRPDILSTDPERQQKLAFAVLDVRERFFRAIVQHRPASAVFLKGWLRRVAEQRLLAAEPAQAALGLLGTDALPDASLWDVVPRTEEFDAEILLSAAD